MIAPLVSAKKTFESRRADDDEAKVVGLRINERKMKIRAQTDDEWVTYSRKLHNIYVNLEVSKKDKKGKAEKTIAGLGLSIVYQDKTITIKRCHLMG